MRPLGLGVLAALVIALAAPATVSSKPRAPDVPAAARKQGMAEAPAVMQTLGLGCQVSDARFVGKSVDPKTKATNSFYEVACAPGSMGYILQANPKGESSVFSCVEANTPTAGKPPALPCILPGNADPTAALKPLLASAKVACTPEQARSLGQSKTNTYMEVACREGSGYILITSAPLDPAKPVQAQDCLNYDDTDGNVKCTLTDRATRLKVVDGYVAAANNACVVKERGFLGTSQDGSNYYEASCQDGKGYIYKAAANGSFAQAWDCAKAQAILGGCKLTDARAAATEQATLYTRLAKGAGSSCNVTKYAVFPTTGADEVVELVCADGSGAVGIFKAQAAQSEVIDCAHAPLAGFKCGLTGARNEPLTADLRKFDQKTCVVSNSRVAGKTAKGTVLMEVACADGYKGYMLEYTTSPLKAVGSSGCAFAGGCKLPGNT